MIENDLVEAIIALPDKMFYNTPLTTYIWVLSNRKEERRKGKIQLIDATEMKSPLRKNLGDKSFELSSVIRKEILQLFLNMEENEVSKIFPVEEFGYWTITVERPLRLRVFPEREIPVSLFKKQDELLSVRKALNEASVSSPLDDWNVFAKATRLKAATLKKIRPYITEKDEAAKIVEGEADTDLRDTENIPITYTGGIDGFVRTEILPFTPDAWVDEKKTQIGYEIRFNKYFYKPERIRGIQEIVDDIMDSILGGLEL